MPKEKITSKKGIKKNSLVQLGIILGQLTHLQPTNLQGNKVYLLDGGIYNYWKESLKEILEKEINKD